MKKTVFLIIIVSLLFAFVGCDGELKDKHVWDEGTITKHATCTQEGVKTFTCSHCSATKTEPVAALGHDFTTKTADEKYVASQPTAEKAAEYYYTCSRCGEKGTETFTHGQPHIHEWAVGKTTEATCVLEGSIEYSCSVCKATKTDVLKTLGHDFSKEVVAEKYLAIAAAEGKNPTYYKSCSRCGEKGSETFEHKHSWDEGYISKVATCTDKGEKAFRCTIEGCKEVRTEEIQALGHDYKNVVDERYLKTAATKEKAAEYYESCDRCKEKGSKTFVHGEPLTHEHVWDNGSFTKEPGCVEAGEKTFKCTVEGCDGTKKEPIGALGHDFEEVADAEYLKNEASFTNPAVYYKSCTRCKEKSEETFEYGEALPHEHEYVYTGSKFFTPVEVKGICSKCGAESEDSKTVCASPIGYWESNVIEFEGIEYQLFISFGAENKFSLEGVMNGLLFDGALEGQYSIVKKEEGLFLSIAYSDAEIEIDAFRIIFDDGERVSFEIPIIGENPEKPELKEFHFERKDNSVHTHNVEVKPYISVAQDYAIHAPYTTCENHSHFWIVDKADVADIIHVYEDENSKTCSICGCPRYYQITFKYSNEKEWYIYATEEDGYLIPGEDSWVQEGTGTIYNSGREIYPTSNIVLTKKTDCIEHYFVYEADDTSLKFFVPTPVHGVCRNCNAESEDTKELYKPLEGFWVSEPFEMETEDGNIETWYMISFGSPDLTFDVVNESGENSLGFETKSEYSIVHEDSQNYLRFYNHDAAIDLRVIAEGEAFFTLEMPEETNPSGTVKNVTYKMIRKEGHTHSFVDGFLGSFSSGHYCMTNCGGALHSDVIISVPHDYSENPEVCSVCGYGSRYCTLTFLDPDGETVYFKDDGVEIGFEYTLPIRDDDIFGVWKSGESEYRMGEKFYPSCNETFIFVPCTEHSYSYPLDECEYYFTPSQLYGTCTKCGKVSEESQGFYKPLDGYWKSNTETLENMGDSYGFQYYISLSSNDCRVSVEMIVTGLALADGVINDCRIGTYSIKEEDGKKFLVITPDESGVQSSEYEVVSDDGVSFSLSMMSVVTSSNSTFEFTRISNQYHDHSYERGNTEFYLTETHDMTGHIKKTSCLEHSQFAAIERHSYAVNDGVETCLECGSPRYYEVVFEGAESPYVYITNDKAFDDFEFVIPEVSGETDGNKNNVWFERESGTCLIPGAKLSVNRDLRLKPSYKNL